MERKRNEGFRSLSPAHFGELAAVFTSPQWVCVITSKNKHAGHVCLIFLSGDDTPKYINRIYPKWGTGGRMRKINASE